jgi:hypothetical protein
MTISRAFAPVLGLVVLGLATVGCTPGNVSVSTDDGSKIVVAADGAPASPDKAYLLQVFAVEDAKIFYISGPDGKAVAARAAQGQSAPMSADEAKATIERHGGALAAAVPQGGDKVKIRIPFVGIDVVSDASGENAKVRIDAGGQKIEVDATDAADMAHVRISGADAEAVREFVGDAESLSAQTKAAMLQGLGL